MCNPDEEVPATPGEVTKVEGGAVAGAEAAGLKKTLKKLYILLGVLAAATIALLVSTIVLATRDTSSSVEPPAVTIPGLPPTFAPPREPNPCQGLRPDWPNTECVMAEFEGENEYATGEQSGANVTKGYVGGRNTTAVPITGSYKEAGLCPVNVHWHLGTEHYSVGEYDEFGTGPIEFHEGRIGFQCRYYNASNPIFTQPYDWQYCIGMTIGQTYEIHWPHSAAGECDSAWQYQTPFYDGVFCKGVEFFTDTAAQIGVQSQTFTVVNDDSGLYDYPDLFHGMIIDERRGMGVDIAAYTGSTTGTARDNKICSPFTPITWQVDRKCHIISARSFDKMCLEMRMQADNLDDDLYAHGSRVLVADEHVANNQVGHNRKLGVY